jgi:hypothetical protein
MSHNENRPDVTRETLEEMLGPVVSIDGIDNETDDNKVDGVMFELYKEATSVVNFGAHLMDEAAAALATERV